MKDSNELFELCKQVYEATGWRLPIDERPVEYWVQHDDEWDLEYGVVGMPVDGGVVPLYTSDYLLEKLPATVKNDFDGGNDYIILYKKGKSWCADYMGQFKRQKSDTPLKALLKLCLALHEEKTL